MPSTKTNPWWALADLRKLGITFTGEGLGIDIAKGVRLDCGRGRGPLIQIGDHVTITMGGHLLTHDASGAKFDQAGTVGKVIIEDHVFIGVHSILMAGTRIQKGSILAAGSVLYSGSDIPSGEVWGGNPARRLSSVETYLEKRKSIPLAKGGQRINIPPAEVRMTGVPKLRDTYLKSMGLEDV